MPGVLCVDAVGLRLGFEFDEARDDVEAAVRRAWADAARPCDQEPDETIPVRFTDVDEGMENLSQRVTHAALQAGRGRLWMLHAAGVAAESGDVVVLVGPSGRGKTTAARALGRVFGYVSDETIAIDPDGGVRAYRKPLSVIAVAGAPKVQVAPSELGLRPLPDAALRVRAIVLLDRDPAHVGAPVLAPVELGDALDELVAQSSYLVHGEAPLRFLASVVAAVGGVRRLTYADAEDLLPVVAPLLAPVPAPLRIPPLAPTPVAGTVARPRPAASDPSRSSRTDQPRYSRAEAIDVVALDDDHERIAVLTGADDDDAAGMVHVIGGIAPAVWRAADDATLGQLTAAAVATHGVPQGVAAEEAVAAVIEALVEAGLLVADARLEPAPAAGRPEDRDRLADQS